MVYQICDVMVNITTWDRVYFSVLHLEEIWEHRFHLGVLDGAMNLTLQ